MQSKSNDRGEILTISLIFVGIVLIILIFVFSIFMSYINTILYNLKIDMYSLNRSAIIAVNKYHTSIDAFSYDKYVYKQEFVKGLKSNYDLNDNLENENKLISKIEIVEYAIYGSGQKDSYTNKRSDDRVLHTVLIVKISPIILKSYLEDIFVFTIHEDVALNSMKTEMVR